MNRRKLLSILASAPALVLPRAAVASPLPRLDVYRSSGCGCCEGWVQHMRDAGFELSIADDPDLYGRLARLGIPAELGSCHVATAKGFAFVGHIPSQDIVRFLDEAKPDVIGLAVPGMPAGSPGMGPEGSGGPYDVLLLKAGVAPSVYATHQKS